MAEVGIHSECSPLKRAAVKRPQEAFTSQYIINTKWEMENWTAPPDYNRAAEQHFQFLKRLAIPARFQPEDFVHSLNSIYLRDAALVTPDGKHIVMRMTDFNRAGEPHEASAFLDQLGIEQLGEVYEPAVANGSDFYWLRKDLLLAALTEFTNKQAIDQVLKLLKENPATVTVRLLLVDLSETNKNLSKNCKTRCHLVSALSMVREDLLVLCPDRFPAGFAAELKGLGFQFIEVPLEAWDCGAAEILPLNERKCFMIQEGEESQKVAEALKVAGQKVELVSAPALRLGRGGLVSMLLCYARLRA